MSWFFGIDLHMTSYTLVLFQKLSKFPKTSYTLVQKKNRRLRRSIYEYFNVFRVTKLSETLLHHLVCRRRDFLWFLMQNNWIFYRHFVFPTAKAQNFRLRRTIFSSYMIVPKARFLKFSKTSYMVVVIYGSPTL